MIEPEHSLLRFGIRYDGWLSDGTPASWFCPDSTGVHFDVEQFSYHARHRFKDVWEVAWRCAGAHTVFLFTVRDTVTASEELGIPELLAFIEKVVAERLRSLDETD